MKSVRDSGFGLNERALLRLYTELGKTDKEIAEFFDCDRTNVVHLRKKYKIDSRDSTGLIGERVAIEEMKNRGFEVKNMNDNDMTSIYDVLLNDEIRIEIKTASVHLDCFSFILTDKSTNGNVESDIRMKLKNGRMKKIYRKTCDYFILVCLDRCLDNDFYIIPSNQIKDDVQTLKIQKNKRNQYSQFKNNWDVLKNSTAPTVDQEKLS